jgi:hypothetical protein
VSQYMWRSSHVMVLKLSWMCGLWLTPPFIPAMLAMRDGAEGSLQCEASGLHPQQIRPNLRGKIHFKGVRL